VARSYKEGKVICEGMQLVSENVKMLAEKSRPNTVPEKLWYIYVRNRPATEPVILKVCNVKLSFDIWLVLYMYFILYF